MREEDLLPRPADTIKDGLRHCSEDGCRRCPYEADCNMADGFSVLAWDALALIRKLERQIADLTKGRI